MNVPVPKHSPAATQWSVSKANPRCWRAWYFSYVLSWNGWFHTAPQRSQEAYKLKNLQSRAAWAGSEVHRAIAHVLHQYCQDGTLRTQRSIETELFNRFMAARANSLVLNAQRFDTKPKKFWRFDSDYFQWNLRPEAWLEVWDGMRASINTFYSDDIWSRISEIPPANFLAIDPRLEEDRKGELELPSCSVMVKLKGAVSTPMKVQVVLDLAYRDPEVEGEVRIIDWKSGLNRDDAQTDNNQLQRRVYGLVLHNDQQVPPEKIVTETIYLREQGPLRHNVERLSLPMLAETEKAIGASVREIRGKFTHPETGQANEDSFPCTKDVKKCEFCCFVPICPGAPKWRQKVVE